MTTLTLSQKRSIAGRRGYLAMIAKHWQGDELAAKQWRAAYGVWVSAKNSYASNWWWLKFPHPGPHPSWSKEDAKICKCTVPARDCICNLVVF